MKVVRHEQRQPRLHQRRNEEQFGQANRNSHHDCGHRQAEGVADESL